MNIFTILAKLDAVEASLDGAKVQTELVRERLMAREGTDLNDRPNSQDKHGLNDLAAFVRRAESYLQDVTDSIGGDK